MPGAFGWHFIVSTMGDESKLQPLFLVHYCRGQFSIKYLQKNLLFILLDTRSNRRTLFVLERFTHMERRCVEDADAGFY